MFDVDILPDFSDDTEDPNKLDDAKIVSDSDSKIEFLCDRDLYTAVPEPQPANKVLPDWYENLEPKMGDGLHESTVRRCMPFLDATTEGWIIPLMGEVAMEVKDDEMNINWNMDRKLIGRHNPEQVGGDMFPLDKPVLKFNNYWAIKVPKGYSVLFTSPFNRIEKRFKVFSGVVDCDQYFNYINFPFLWLDESNQTTVLNAGTPLVQAIPFKREERITKAETRPLTNNEQLEVSRQQNRLNSQESDYRNDKWVSKKGTRMVNKNSND